jgi:hypothetical protein
MVAHAVDAHVFAATRKKRRREALEQPSSYEARASGLSRSMSPCLLPCAVSGGGTLASHTSPHGLLRSRTHTSHAVGQRKWATRDKAGGARVCCEASCCCVHLFRCCILPALHCELLRVPRRLHASRLPRPSSHPHDAWGTQYRLCSLQCALWHSLPQYMTLRQREQWDSSAAAAPAPLRGHDGL